MTLRKHTPTAQKMKFSITDFINKYDQIRRKLRIWSHLLNKSVMENFIFSAIAHVNKNCHYQTDATGRTTCTKSVQINLKPTNDVMIQRSRDFGKIR